MNLQSPLPPSLPNNNVVSSLSKKKKKKNPSEILRIYLNSIDCNDDHHDDEDDYEMKQRKFNHDNKNNTTDENGVDGDSDNVEDEYEDDDEIQILNILHSLATFTTKAATTTETTTTTNNNTFTSTVPTHENGNLSSLSPSPLSSSSSSSFSLDAKEVMSILDKHLSLNILLPNNIIRVRRERKNDGDSEVLRRGDDFGADKSDVYKSALTNARTLSSSLTEKQTTETDRGRIRHEWECALIYLKLLLLKSWYNKKNNNTLNEAKPKIASLKPPDLIRIALDCHSLTSYDDNSKSLLSSMSLLAVRLGIIALAWAYNETLENLEQQQEQKREGQEMMMIDCHYEHTTTPKVKTKTPTSIVIRWRRIASMTSQVIELTYRSLVYPVKEKYTSYNDDVDSSNDEENDVNEAWSDEEESNKNHVIPRCRPPLDYANLCSSLLISFNFVNRLLSVSSELLWLIHNNCYNDDDDESRRKMLSDRVTTTMTASEKYQQRKIKKWIVNTSVITAVGLAIETIDLIHQVCIFRGNSSSSSSTSSCELLGDKEDNDDVAINITNNGRQMIQTLSHHVLSLPIRMMNDVLIHPLREDAYRKQSFKEESRLERRREHSTQTRIVACRHILENRMERFRNNPMRRYFDGVDGGGAVIPWSLRGIAIIAHCLICYEQESLSSSSPSVYPWGVYTHDTIWNKFWPHVSTLLQSNYINEACELTHGLCTRIPMKHVTLTCWNNDDEKSSIVSHPTNIMGFVGPVQLFINAIISLSSSSAAASASKTALLSSTGEKKGQQQQYGKEEEHRRRKCWSSTEVLQIVKFSLLPRIKSIQQRCKCISMLVKQCPYPTVVPLLLDMTRSFIIPLNNALDKVERMDEDSDDDDYPREESPAAAAAAPPPVDEIMCMIKPFLDEMEEYCSEQQQKQEEEERNNCEQGKKRTIKKQSASSNHHDNSMSATMMMMERNEIYHSTVNLLGLLCRYLSSNTSSFDDDEAKKTKKNVSAVTSNTKFTHAMEVLRQCRQYLSHQLNKWSEAQCAMAQNEYKDDVNDERPLDYFRLYLLVDAIDSTLRFAKESCILVKA